SGKKTPVARWVENHRASPSFDGRHALWRLKVRGRTPRTPSMEMPPGKLERAKTLAWDRDLDFRSSHRLRGRVFFTRGATDAGAEALQADPTDQPARTARNPTTGACERPSGGPAVDARFCIRPADRVRS